MSRRTHRLILLAVSAALSAFAAEAILRLSGIPAYQPFTSEPIPFVEPHDALGWFNVPNTDAVIPWGPRQVRVAHNALGFRDRPIVESPGKRVLVLGDSYAWGYGVDQAEVAIELLDRRLADVDVVNMGVNGFSTDQSLLLLESHGHSLKPDAVLLMAFGNDEDGNMRRVNYFRYPKPRFVLEDGKLNLEPVPPLPLLDRWIDIGRRHSALFTGVAFHFQTAKVFPFPTLRVAAGRVRGNPTDSAATLAALIGAIDGRTRELGARLGIVVVVSQSQVVKQADVEFRGRLAKIAEELSLPLLNLTEPFARHLASASAADLALSWDDHWSPAAHELVAKEIELFIRSEELWRLKPVP